MRPKRTVFDVENFSVDYDAPLCLSVKKEVAVRGVLQSIIEPTVKKPSELFKGMVSSDFALQNILRLGALSESNIMIPMRDINIVEQINKMYHE